MILLTDEEKRTNYVQHVLRGHKQGFQPLSFAYYMVLCSIIEAEILGD